MLTAAVRERLERLELLLSESTQRLHSFAGAIDDAGRGVLGRRSEALRVIARTLALEADTQAQIVAKLAQLTGELAEERRAIARPQRRHAGVTSLAAALSPTGDLVVVERLRWFDALPGSRTIGAADVWRIAASLLVDRFHADVELAAWLQARGIESVASAQP